METLLVILGFLIMLLGIAGSFLPIIPGPLTSWLGLLILSFSDVEVKQNLLIGTFAVALIIYILDFIIPALGTKKYGGSRYGMVGATLGLLVGLLAPIPLGIVIGPFLGALFGEFIYQKNSQLALRAAYGSLIGFVSSTLIKFVVALVYLGIFIWLLV